MPHHSKWSLLGSVALHGLLVLLFVGTYIHPRTSFEILPIKAIHVRFYDHLPFKQATPQVHHRVVTGSHPVLVHQPIPKPNRMRKQHLKVHPRRAQHELKGKQLNQLVNYLFAVIHQHYHYPDDAAAMEESGVSVVAFELLPTGVVRHVHLLHSSGYALLDQAALVAVKDAAPFTQAQRYIKQLESFSLPIQSA